MCGPNWQTESIYVPCNRWCFNDKDILRQFQPQRKKKNHLAGVKIRVDYGVDFNATNWSVHKNLLYTTFEHTRYIMTVMLRNQFRKQTKNTAKHLHLNYQALILCSNYMLYNFRKEHVLHPKIPKCIHFLKKIFIIISCYFQRYTSY